MLARVFHGFPFWKKAAAAGPDSPFSSFGRSSDLDSSVAAPSQPIVNHIKFRREDKPQTVQAVRQGEVDKV
jgi:hypothetical protein